MRDLEDYQQQYQELPFESVQVELRKQYERDFLTGISARRILEIGCGMAPISTRYDDFEQLAIIEPAEHFAQKLLNAGLDSRIRIFIELFEAFDFSELGFRPDAVLLSSLLHELEQPDAVLRKLHQHIDSNTQVLVNVPNAHSLHRVLAQEMGLIETIYEASAVNQQMQQQRVFDMRSLTELVIDCGFAVSRIETLFVKPFTHAQMAKMLDLGIIDQQVLDGLNRLTRHLPTFGSEICAVLLPGK